MHSNPKLANFTLPERNMSRSTVLPPVVLSVLRTISSAATAGSDPATAREQLQVGYALREQGKCDAAIPHLKESVRLDSSNPKAFMNLADCEDKLDRLAAAQADFVMARNLAQTQHLDDLAKEAQRRILGVERRMPKLIIRLAKDAPADTVVVKDGTELGAISLGTPIPIDPGSHIILARAGTASKSYNLSIVEGESKQIAVSPGSQPSPAAPRASTPTTAAASERISPTSASYAGTMPTGRSTESPESSARRIATFVAAGVGLAGTAVGVIYGLKAISKSNDAENTCPPFGCFDPAHATFEDLRGDATSARTTATTGFLFSGVGFATAAILLLTSGNSQSHSETSVLFGLRNNDADVTIRGTW